MDELDFREKGGYKKVTVQVHIEDENNRQIRTVNALLYLGNTRNPNFL